MAWVACDNNGSEYIYDSLPIRDKIMERWELKHGAEHFVELPKGSIKKLIGRDLTFEDNPVELK